MTSTITTSSRLPRHHPVRDGFADADSRHVPHLVVEALDVLDVETGQHSSILASRITITSCQRLRPFGAGHIGTWANSSTTATGEAGAR